MSGTAAPEGLHRIELPLGDNPLGAVNAYLIDRDDGPVLIDTGWRTPETRAALAAALARLGRSPDELRAIVLTHGHPDHCELAAELRGRSGAPVLPHEGDWPALDPARLHGGRFMRESGACLTWAGGRARWADLPPFQRALALAETIAHLGVLRARGQARRAEDGAALRYASVEREPQGWRTVLGS